MRPRLFNPLRLNPTWLRYITVEPALIFFAISHILCDFLNTNLYLQKSCRDDKTREPDLNTFCDDERRGITYVSWINTNFVCYKMILTVLCAALVTSWSDEAGRRRRPLILLPIAGQILESASGCVQSYFWHWSPIDAVVSNFIIHVLFGGMTLFGIGCYVYICETSSFENRTMRLGIISAIKMVCTPVTNGFAGFVFRQIGFLHCYLLCLMFSLISMLYAVTFIRDTSVPIKTTSTVWKSFNLCKLPENFKVVFKKSLGQKRIIVGILLMIQVLVVFATEGEKSIFYLYFRYGFKWDERTYGYYIAYKLVGVIVGTIFCSVILSRVYKIHDGLIGAFAGFWDTIAVLCYLNADQTWQLYTIPLLDIFHGAAKDAYGSFLSKFYSDDEFGRLSSVIMTFGLIVPICHPIYNTVFRSTMDYFPSAFFMISAIVDVLVCFLYGCTYVLSKKMI
ncbi:proton-coupled folate transporter-like [Planococcus citri]|uniref:proton-coupled folate transporter-like n=1 Tax=Planococcus citri TaxID=170843 RepID=UPI0031F7F315